MTKEEVKRILFKNKEILKKYRVKSLALFDSYIINEQREGSDIDFWSSLRKPLTITS